MPLEGSLEISSCHNVAVQGRCHFLSPFIQLASKPAIDTCPLRASLDSYYVAREINSKTKVLTTSM